ncbi:MAG: FHA domain-containing protein [Clostridiales Family XIII bacterium]|jgi:hypothetical protein|nr:FHA domain-containing protein [Clostridiales Family XIII bacterium]
MNLTRCENGHFYDSDRFDSCPHCNQASVSTVLQNDEGEKEYTMPLESQEEAQPAGLKGLIGEAKGVSDDAQNTIGYFGDVDSEPVVGWLVAISGGHFGEDFRLKTGRNFIGRSPEMDVALTGDASISRDKHAIILYEPKGNMFLVQPGASKELFYVNEKVVLSAMEIAAYDILALGETNLMFIPWCSDKFNWDSVKPAEEKQ